MLLKIDPQIVGTKGKVTRILDLWGDYTNIKVTSKKYTGILFNNYPVRKE